MVQGEGDERILAVFGNHHLAHQGIGQGIGFQCLKGLWFQLVNRRHGHHFQRKTLADRADGMRQTFDVDHLLMAREPFRNLMECRDPLRSEKSVGCFHGDDPNLLVIQ